MEKALQVLWCTKTRGKLRASALRAAAPRSSHPSSSSLAGPLLPADKKVDVEFAVRFDMLLCFDIYRPGQVYGGSSMKGRWTIDRVAERFLGQEASPLHTAGD